MPPLHFTSNPFAGLPRHRSKVQHNPYLSQIMAEKKTHQLPLFSGEELRYWRGRWRQLWQHDASKRQVAESQLTGLGSAKAERRPLVLEIGCHRGDVLRELIRHHPRACFLGMDITLKRVYLAARGIQDLAAGDGAVIYGRAEAMVHFFAAGELDGVVVFFPDPWVKKLRQRKHRLWNECFVENLKQVMREGAFLWFKTDVWCYFKDTHKLLCAAGFHPLEKELWVTENGDYTSLFERRCRQQGKEVYEARYQMITERS